MILSQILRGLADVTAAEEGTADPTVVDAALLGAGLRHGVELVITSMGGREVPGTIVSVLQAAAAAVEQCAARGGVGRGGDRRHRCRRCRAGEDHRATRRAGPGGVVDAGGRGLLVLLDALRSTITGQAPVRPVYQPSPRPRSAEAVTEQPAPQFEVMYLLGECAPEDTEALRERLTQLGESVAIATSGWSAVIRSTFTPTTPVPPSRRASHSAAAAHPDLGAGRGHRPAAGQLARERAVLAVVDGEGAQELFDSEGACVLRPDAHSADPTMMVTAQQLLRAVVDTGAAQVMLLPNGYVAAEELVAGCTAAIGWGIDVVPVPTGSMVQGLSALAVHDPGRRLSTTATPWPGWPVPPGTARCVSPPSRR